jgi:hypothetical protein
LESIKLNYFVGDILVSQKMLLISKKNAAQAVIGGRERKGVWDRGRNVPNNVYTCE